MNNFSKKKFRKPWVGLNSTVCKLTRLFAIITIAFTLTACGGGGDTDGTTPTDTNGGGTDQNVILSGTLSDTFSKPSGSSGRLLAADDWVGALIEIIDLSGNVVATATADGSGSGSFSVGVPAGGPYFIRATIGNLVLAAYAPSSDTDQTISVDPQSTAIVNVLGAMAGVDNLGEAGVDASGSLPADIDAAISSIEDSPLLDDIADAIAQDIADNYDADATEPSVGGGGTAGDDLTVIIAGAQSDKTAPSTNAAPAGGTFSTAQNVILSCSDVASECYATYYTTDGSDPTTGSPVYSTLISINSNTTLQFFSIDNAGNAEPVNTEEFIILNPTTTYTITASAGSGGGISPSGAVTVNEGDDQSFTITPNVGYSVADVSVDGASEGAITAYTFTNVTANYTISAMFELIPPNTYTVGGNVSGLTGSGLVLDLNSGAQSLPVSAGATSFTFTTPLADGSTYAVTVSTNPDGQACTVMNGSGTIAGANVTDVIITCSNMQKSWTHPADITDYLGFSGSASTAMDNNGNAIVVRSNGGIFKSEYRGGSWIHPSDSSDYISPDDEYTSQPDVAMDDNGNAIIVWEQSDGSNTQIFKSEYRNGSWTHPSSLADNISPDGQDALLPKVAMDNNGNAIIAWGQYDGSTDCNRWRRLACVQVYMSEYRNGSWTHPANLTTDAISPDGQNADDTQVTMDNNGNAIIVWRQADGTTDCGLNSCIHIFKSEYRNENWAHPADLSDNISPDGLVTSITSSSPNIPTSPQVAMDNNGNAIIVWSQLDSSTDCASGISCLQVFKSEYRNGSWTHPLSLSDNISPDGGDYIFLEPHVAMDDNGNAIIAWNQLGPPAWMMYKSEYRNGTWTYPDINEYISPSDGSSVWESSVAMGNNGDATIVWRQWDGTTYHRILFSDYRNGIWTHPTSITNRISPDGGEAIGWNTPHVAMDNNGNTIMIWLQDWRLFMSEYR